MNIRRSPIGYSLATYRSGESQGRLAYMCPFWSCLFLSLRELKGENNQIAFHTGERPSGWDTSLQCGYSPQPPFFKLWNKHTWKCVENKIALFKHWSQSEPLCGHHPGEEIEHYLYLKVPWPCPFFCHCHQMMTHYPQLYGSHFLAFQWSRHP